MEEPEAFKKMIAVHDSKMMSKRTYDSVVAHFNKN